MSKTKELVTELRLEYLGLEKLPDDEVKKFITDLKKLVKKYGGEVDEAELLKIRNQKS